MKKLATVLLVLLSLSAYTQTDIEIMKATQYTIGLPSKDDSGTKWGEWKPVDIDILIDLENERVSISNADRTKLNLYEFLEAYSKVDDEGDKISIMAYKAVDQEGDIILFETYTYLDYGIIQIYLRYDEYTVVYQSTDIDRIEE